MPFRSINPATLEVLGEYPSLSEEGVLAAIETASRALRGGEAGGGWGRMTPAARGAKLVEVARNIRARAEALAQLATAEMGKPIRQSRAEVEKCAAGLEYAGANAGRWLETEQRVSGGTGGGRGMVRFEPLGVLLAVMPWNFPYWQIVRFCCGALAAGNCVLIKPAPSTVGCALALERCFREAGLGVGGLGGEAGKSGTGGEGAVYQTLLAEVEDLEVAVAHKAVAGVSLTGSVKAGRGLASVAGRHGKLAVLELGGSDPFVVLGDADVKAAARAAAEARCLNSGQSCIAGKRFIAVAEVYETFREAFVAEMRSKKIGDPTREETDIGPLARGDLREALVNQLLAARAKGGVSLLQGGPRDGMGYYFNPDIVELPFPEGSSARSCGIENPVWTGETFGPLAALVRAEGEEHAITLANDTRYGLGASVWTNPLRAEDLAGRFESGNVFFNDTVKSLPELPFGGVKDSGIGRELGMEGARAFANVKTVWVG